jgi:hypothetical protein
VRPATFPTVPTADGRLEDGRRTPVFDSVRAAEGERREIDMGLLDRLGLKLPPHRESEPVEETARSAGRAPRAKPAAKPKSTAPVAEVVLGEAHVERLALGPAVDGVPAGVLWALLAADTGQPLDRSNARLGAQLNETGRLLLAGFGQLATTRALWRSRQAEAEALARQSPSDLEKMRQAADAIGRRARRREGAYVRAHTEDYLRAQRELEDRLRAVAPLAEAMHGAVSAVHTVTLRQQARRQEQAVEKAKGRVAAEEARIEEVRGRLTGMIDIAFRVARQDWKSLAEDAAKYVGGQIIEAMPTKRLDRLREELRAASAHLRGLDDGVLLSELETAASGLRKATRDLEDARLDIDASIASLALAQRTAIEALGESRGTLDAAQMLAKKARMLKTMAEARQAVERWQRQASPLRIEIERCAGLYRSLPDVARATPGIDPDGEYVRSLAATALENAETLTAWKAHIARDEADAQAALATLSDTGDEGLLAHFNRVPEVLQEALESR